MLMALTACGGGASISPSPPPVASSAPADATQITTLRDPGTPLGAIIDTPDEYLGAVVVVRGEVVEQFGPGALAMADTRLGDLDVIPVLLTPGAGALPAASMVAVTGEVRLLDLAALEGELGVDLPDQALAHFDGRPVLLASSIAADSSSHSPGPWG
jgi:hypothetical protein